MDKLAEKATISKKNISSRQKFCLHSVNFHYIIVLFQCYQYMKTSDYKNTRKKLQKYR